MDKISAKIIRHNDNGFETLGRWFTLGTDGIDRWSTFDCYTLERPWKNNQHGISCIPKGKYQCEKIGPTDLIPYEHIWVKDVPDRDGICVHVGNFIIDTHGCILVGQSYADINKDGQMDVPSSKKTFTALMASLPNKFELEVL